MLSVSAAEPSSQSRRDVGERGDRPNWIEVVRFHGSGLTRGLGSNGKLQRRGGRTG